MVELKTKSGSDGPIRFGQNSDRAYRHQSATMHLNNRRVKVTEG